MDAAEARALDEVAADATPSPLQVDVAGWRCKAAPDLPFRRCNTVLPPIGATEGRQRFDDALAQVRAWYDDLGQRLIVQVSSADPDHHRLDTWLAEAGLVVEAPVDLLVALDPPAPLEEAGPTVHVSAGIDEGWSHRHGVVAGADATQRRRAEAYGRMLEAFGPRALGASATVDGHVVGVGFGVTDRGWLGIFGMATASTHRRRGIGTAVVTALRAEAARAGTTRAYLQVETGNDAALTLYRGLGFERHHGYHYRSDGVDPAQGC